MDYEKKYKEALARAKEFQKSKDGLCVLTAESIFPELTESEDEKIRKWLYDYISNCPNNNFAFYGGVGKDAVLNYLEKQKELFEPEETLLCARLAAERLNKMELGVQFFGNLFPYLRKRGKLEGLCELGKQGKRPVWLYDTDGIADLVRKGKLEYNPR